MGTFCHICRSGGSWNWRGVNCCTACYELLQGVEAQRSQEKAKLATEHPFDKPGGVFGRDYIGLMVTLDASNMALDQQALFLRRLTANLREPALAWAARVSDGGHHAHAQMMFGDVQLLLIHLGASK